MEQEKIVSPHHLQLMRLLVVGMDYYGKKGNREKAQQHFKAALYAFDTDDTLKILSKIRDLMNSTKGGAEKNKEEFEFHMGHFCLRIYSVREKINQLLNTLILDISPDNKDLHDEVRRNKKTAVFLPILTPFDNNGNINEFLKMRRLLTHQRYDFFQVFSDDEVQKLAGFLKKDPREIRTDLTITQMNEYLEKAGKAVAACADTFEKISEKLVEQLREV